VKDIFGAPSFYLLFHAAEELEQYCNQLLTDKTVLSTILQKKILQPLCSTTCTNPKKQDMLLELKVAIEHELEELKKVTKEDSTSPDIKTIATTLIKLTGEVQSLVKSQLEELKAAQT
jgi:hypothetical protein